MCVNIHSYGKNENWFWDWGSHHFHCLRTNQLKKCMQHSFVHRTMIIIKVHHITFWKNVEKSLVTSPLAALFLRAISSIVSWRNFAISSFTLSSFFNLSSYTKGKLLVLNILITILNKNIQVFIFLNYFNTNTMATLNYSNNPYNHLFYYWHDLEKMALQANP